MKKAIITTSANPFHYGHLNLYYRAVELFGKNNVTIVIAKNNDKNINIDNIDFCMKPYNVPYVIYDGLIADYCKENYIDYIVRGVRNVKDCEYELNMDNINKSLNPKTKTLFIPAENNQKFLSSSLLRELLSYNKLDYVSKYMDIHSMYRYNFRNKYPNHPTINVYFGKSCMGKSTYLQNKYKKANIFDWDNYINTVIYKNKEAKNNKKTIFYNDNISKKELKDIIFKDCFETFTNEFWEKLVTDNYNKIWDFASLGFYWEFIPNNVRCKFKLFKYECSNDLRQKYIKAKHFENKMDRLDYLYEEPPFYDEIIGEF